MSGFVLATASLAQGQQLFHRTITVDPTNTTWANWNSIQAAINDPRIGDNPSEKWTVLIFAGTYNETVELSGLKENVDLAGIDRDAVIINAPPAGNGITITSGTENSRNNSIRNLTIRTTNGHGIEIVQGGAPVPKNIAVEGVTIQAAGAMKQGVQGTPAEGVRIFDCNISSGSGDGIAIGHSYEILNTVVTAPSASGAGVSGNAKKAVRIRNCKISGGSSGLNMQEKPEDLQVYASEILGAGTGVFLWDGVNVVFEACDIVGTGHPLSTSGFYVDGLLPLAGDITVVSCRIQALGPGSGPTIGAHTNTDAGPGGQLRLLNCDISAVGQNAAGGEVYGVGPQGAITVVGGSLTTSAAAEKETEVWDVADGPVGTVRVTGTRLSKWKGPIYAAGRQSAVIQRTVDAGAAGDGAILPETDLTATEQSLTTGFTQPDVYRVLSVKGNLLGMNQDVYIVGTDFGGNRITDKVQLNGTATVPGVKPFKTVSKIILPSGQPGQKVSLGRTSKLGLQFPVSEAADLLQQGRKSATATSYTLEPVGTVDPVYATVDVGPVTPSDSFEWAVLASQ